MVQKFQPIGKGSGTLKPAGGIKPFDVETGGVGVKTHPARVAGWLRIAQDQA